MNRLEAAALKAGERARRRALDRLATTLAADLPELHVMIEDDRIAIIGHGVIDDPRLVWIGSMLR